MAKKIYDLAVKTGSYTDRDGNEKGRYLNIGSVLQKEDNGKFLLLNRTVNLAGIPNPENRDTVIVSMFEPKNNNNGGQSDNINQAPEVIEDSSIPF